MKACPKDEPDCVDDPDSETEEKEDEEITETERWLDRVVVTAWRQRSYSDGSRIRLNALPEQLFRVDGFGVHRVDDGYQEIRQICSDGSRREGLRLDSAPFKGGAAGHTHPDRGTGLSGLPGPEDGQFSRAIGGTGYVISSRGAFAIEETSAGFRVRLIAGKSLSRRERTDIQRTISRWNQHGGGSGITCRTVVTK